MNFVKRFAFVLVAMMFISVVASAQTTSNLTGTVTLGGNPLPGATITIASPSLQGTRTTVTDVNGNYNFGALPPGDYTVRFEMESMQSVTRPVRIGLGQIGRANATMQLTSVAEAITVTATAPATLETTEIQTNISAKLASELPVGHNILAMANLAPGVNTNTTVGGQVIISGAPAHENSYIVDGAVVNENLRGQFSNLFIEDALQETTVLTGGISAEYGRFTGGIISSITKSGGNEFSGSLRDSLSSDKWTAVTPAGNPRLNTINPVYEGTLGGRIIRDRLWFFVAGRDAKTSSSIPFASAQTDFHDSFTSANHEKRAEAKLSAALTAKHNFMLTGMHVDVPQTNIPFGSDYEPITLEASRNVPLGFYTAHYNGVLTDNFLLEGLFSKKTLIFEGGGGALGDLAHATPILDLINNAWYGYPVFCSTCGHEYRNNKYYDAKATYYLASKSLGTHNITAGYQNWNELRIANNYQSGSNFIMLSYTGAPTHTSTGLVATISDGDIILATPINTLANGGSKFQTNSLYVNDKWDFGTHLNFNLGARYDKNNGKDANGATRSKDSIVSPRAGVIYDVFGNSKVRLNANYGQYVAKIAETVGDAGASAGAPASIYYVYHGPDLVGSSNAVLQGVQNYFNANGGLFGAANLASIIGANFPGINQAFPNSLRSPNVKESTVGIGSQIGRGYLRADYIHRKWADFYSAVVSPATGAVAGPGLYNSFLFDVTDFVNTNSYKRNYDALQLQGSYQLFSRLQLAGNYTYSKLRGNVIGETRDNGPIAEPFAAYAEFKNFAQNNPIGALASDQRQKARAWMTYDQPTPIGSFTLGVLQRFDTGTPFAAVTNLPTSAFASYVQANLLPAGFSYNGQPGTVSYFLGARDQFRWQSVSGTDLSLDYHLQMGRVQLFAQPAVVNVFNAQHFVSGNTSVTLARAFNPYTQTPTECPQFQASGAKMSSSACRALVPTGGAWFKGVNFGKPTVAGNYQLPRTYRFTVGARF
jgi:Carboxypeptidase regulatory-like domain/TonB dependent receptor/TonB-dependent Receptor Plug Domain